MTTTATLTVTVVVPVIVITTAPTPTFTTSGMWPLCQAAAMSCSVVYITTAFAARNACVAFAVVSCAWREVAVG